VAHNVAIKSQLKGPFMNIKHDTPYILRHRLHLERSKRGEVLKIVKNVVHIEVQTSLGTSIEETYLINKTTCLGGPGGVCEYELTEDTQERRNAVDNEIARYMLLKETLNGVLFYKYSLKTLEKVINQLGIKI
jgi:hypothetical protein